MDREEARIRFRRQMMAVPGGVDWLAYVARLFDHREALLGPGDFGMPQRLQSDVNAHIKECEEGA